jgi:NTE family protein
LSFIEIRPEQPINKSNMPIIGLIDNWLDFSFEQITELQQRGYEDAQRCLQPIIQTIYIIQQKYLTSDSLINSTQKFLDDSSL